MTEMAAERAGASPGKALNIVLWVLQVLVALAFFGASSGKLMGNEQMVGMYEVIGLGQWFRYLTGILEFSGAILVLVPKTRAIGAVLLACVMVGAITTHIFVLHNSPALPIVLLAMTSTIAWGRRAELERFLGK